MELDFGFLGFDWWLVWGGVEVEAVELFHVEHEVEFVVVFFAVVECIFCGEE